MSNLDWFRVEWIWEKPMGTNYLNANKDPMKNHESVLVFCDGYPTYNPQMEKGKPYITTRGNVGGYIKDKTANGYVTKNNGDRYPKTVNKFGTPKEKLHPTQKPLELLEYLLKTYSNQNDLILDNCAGSGSTLVACQNTNRSFIGIEKEKDYVDIATKRIEDNQRLLNSMLIKPWQSDFGKSEGVSLVQIPIPL